MRCSTRDRNLLCPSFITSTPLALRNDLSRRPPNISPILENKNSLETKKPRHRKTTDFENLNTFVNSMPANTRKMKNASQMESIRSSEARLSKIKQRSNFLEEFCNDREKTGRRTSRIDAIVKEAVRESHTKSILVFKVESDSDDSDNGLDEVIEKEKFLRSSQRLTRSSQAAESRGKELSDMELSYTGKEVIMDNETITPHDSKTIESGSPQSSKQILKNRDIKVKPVLKTNKKSSRSRSKVSKQKTDDKENLVGKIRKGNHEVDLFLVKNAEKLSKSKVPTNTNIPVPEEAAKTLKRSLQEDPPLPAKKQCPEVNIFRDSFVPYEDENQSAGGAIAPKIGGVVYKLDEICKNDWKKLKDLEGISVRRTLSIENVSVGLVKLEPSMKLQKVSSSRQIFVVVEGLGIVNIDSKETKIGPGDQVLMESGCEYLIQCRGKKKNLILNYTKFSSLQ